jgi:DNA (cytosine-5)-methyltransferase 1
MRQLGNAVPVTLAERVARSVALALKSADSTKQ